MVPFNRFLEAPTFDRCPVEFVGDSTMNVLGLDAPMPQGVAYRAVMALVKTFPGGLSRQAPNVAANDGDARNALRDLTDAHPLWRAALRFPREKGDYRNQSLGYRIPDSSGVFTSMVKLAAAGEISEVELLIADASSDDYRERREAS